MRPATLVAAMGMAAYQPLFFSGVDRVGVAVGTLLTIGSAPVFVGAIESAITGTGPPRIWVIATITAIAGLTLLAFSQGDQMASSIGALLALAAGLSYAVYVVSAARLAQAIPARQSTASIFGLAAVMLLPVALTQDLSFAASPGGAGMVLWLGLAATAAAYLLFTSGLKATEAGAAATLTLGEPVTATLLAVWALGETPGASGWAGIALIGAGLALAAHPASTAIKAKHV